MRIKIDEDLSIGDMCPTFIIAEVGSNWTSLDDCLKSIQVAKECGADAVKFQLFDQMSLYGYVPGLGEANRTNRNEVTIINFKSLLGMSPYLHPDWIPKLAAHSKSIGIEFMCSAFSPELIDVVDPYVRIHKLASAEMCHIGMLQRLEAIGKPVVMSMGSHSEKEIELSLEILGPQTDVVLLYCVANYPARSVRCENVRLLAHRFSRLTGFSDHTTNVLKAPQEAVRYGACVIEKHFTIIPTIDTPDRGHSLDPNQFKAFVEAVRTALDYDDEPSPQEAEMRSKHNRRLIAVQDIQEGETFREGENFGIFRGLQASGYPELGPFDIQKVAGKTARSFVKTGQAIGVHHI